MSADNTTCTRVPMHRDVVISVRHDLTRMQAVHDQVLAFYHSLVNL